MKDQPDSLQPQCIAFFFFLYRPLQECQGSYGMAERAQGFAQSLALDWLDQRQVNKTPQCLLTHWRMCRPPMIDLARGLREPERRWHPEEGGWPLITRDPGSSKPASWCCGNPHTGVDHEGVPHTKIRGRTEGRCSSRKHRRSSQLHGGSRRLETPLEESSQDGLDEMSFELDVSVNNLAEKTTCLGSFSRHFEILMSLQTKKYKLLPQESSVIDVYNEKQ